MLSVRSTTPYELCSIDSYSGKALPVYALFYLTSGYMYVEVKGKSIPVNNTTENPHSQDLLVTSLSEYPVP